MIKGRRKRKAGERDKGRKIRFFVRLNTRAIKSLDKWFKDMGGHYIVSKTNSSTVYSNKHAIVVAGKTFLGKGALGLISKTKAEVRKAVKDKNLGKVSVKYVDFNYNLLDIEHVESVTEIDLSAAYVTSAFKQGFISDKLYLRLLNCSKEIRLRVLGSLGTTKYHFEHKNGKIIKTWRTRDEQLYAVWTHICYGVQKVMEDLKRLLGTAYVMYWVDGIYFRQYDFVKSIVQDHLGKNGWSFKVKDLKLSWKFQRGYIHLYKEGAKGEWRFPVSKTWRQGGLGDG